MKESSIQLYDPSNMRKLLAEFPAQIELAVRIGRGAKTPYKAKNIGAIVLSGLGGSAIGGDVLRSYLADELRVPFVVNRHYALPEFVDSRTLVIIASYSGGTEETVAAHHDAIRRKAKVLCISSNGETARLAGAHRQPLITIPGGLPPRTALGYSFFPMLIALSSMGFIPSKEKEIRETVRLLRKLSKTYGTLSNKKNPALELAKQLYNKLPVVYSSADRFDVVNTRWRGQLAENSKVLAFGHVLPEMNHNELVGWKALRRQMGEMAVVFLRDAGDHDRVKIRMEITKSIVGEYASKVLEVESEGSSLLARMFSLIYLGDWVSFYLAIMNGIDPTPVRVIDYLKRELSKV
jgi:glucose/mannose-6-phosphate isomerase